MKSRWLPLVSHTDLIGGYPKQMERRWLAAISTSNTLSRFVLIATKAENVLQNQVNQKNKNPYCKTAQRDVSNCSCSTAGGLGEREQGLLLQNCSASVTCGISATVLVAPLVVLENMNKINISPSSPLRRDHLVTACLAQLSWSQEKSELDCCWRAQDST